MEISNPENIEIGENIYDVDDNSVKKYYELNEVKRSIGRKFNMESHDHKVRFWNICTLKSEEFPIKVHQILGEIFTDVLGPSIDNSKIRVYMDADGLSNPYNGPFVNCADFEVNRAISSMAKYWNPMRKFWSKAEKCALI